MTGTLDPGTLEPDTTVGGEPPERDSSAASLAALRDLVDAASVGIGLFDAEQRYVVVNPALASINGLSPEQHLGRRVHEVVPDLAAQVGPILDEVWSTGLPANDVTVVGHTPAHRSEAREFLASFSRVETDGRPAGIGVVVSDVTDLRRAERRLRQLIDGLFTFVGLCDPDGVLTEANRTALDAADLDVADVIGKPFWETYWWSYDAAVQEQLRAAIALAREGVPSRYDVDVRVRGGILITIDFQLVPIVEDGRVTAMVPSGMDVEARRRNERQLEATASLARGLSMAITTDDVVSTILRDGRAALDADLVEVAMVHDTVVRRFHVPPDAAGSPASYDDLPLDAPVPICDAIARRERVTVAAGHGDTGRYAQVHAEVRAAGYSTTSASPLVSEGRVIGALGVGWRPQRQVGPVDEAHLSIVSKLCAQTLGRTIRADRQEEFFSSLQRHLLPVVPEIPGLDVAVRYEPATEGIGFGGDWYDVVVLDDHRTAFIVGDIAGHGIDAAAEMAVVRSTINALVRLETPLADLPRLVRSAVVGSADRFVGTAVIAVVDIRRRRCDYVSAGHLPPVVLHPTGRVDHVDTLGNGPLGVSTGPVRSGSFDFDPGSTLVLYTDGLVERRGEIIDEGLDRLTTALGVCGGDASVMLECITESLRPSSGSWRDDVALIVIRS